MAEGPELFIGLVGAVGTDLREVVNLLEQELRVVNYDAQVIKISNVFSSYPLFAEGRPGLEFEDDRIDRLMTAGDAVRERAARGDALVMLSVIEIQRIRQEIAHDSLKPLNRTAFIFHSLKHPDEVATLRRIYGRSFVLFSVYSPLSQRIEQLKKRIAKSRNSYSAELFDERARELILRDHQESGTSLGQNVSSTFPEGDFFIDASNGELPGQIKRLISILFGHPFLTPSVDEYGMFHAKAAALRSADLSRQVGAVITSTDGEIICAGCNEVPKSGGGSFWRGDEKEKDYRDFKIGHDSAARMKYEVVKEILEKLKADWLREELQEKTADQLTDLVLYDTSLGKPLLKGTRVDSLLEFGRIVHAEMSAITESARRGLPIKGSSLYCTTFPCHMCARHIIASGLHEVIYIEPYPKSMAKDLYQRSIRVDGDNESDDDAVVFRPFVGVSPRRYLELFQMKERKNKRGLACEWAEANSLPSIDQIVDYDALETTLVEATSGIIAMLMTQPKTDDGQNRHREG